MIDGVLLLWFFLTAGSVFFVVYDSVTNTRTSWVQKLAWILVTIYTGPIGLFVYFLTCRSPGPGMHEAFTSATWKQSVNSEIHCLAGDATGIVIAAAIVPAFGLPNGWDLVLEYTSAFLVGLFVFQALMMISMFDGNYFLAVRKTFFAETVSMNAVMVGMIPTMMLLMRYVPHAREPWFPEFWFVMGMAAIVGGLTAYPMNWWLVTNHLKHGCMTLPEGDLPAPKMGHGSAETPAPMNMHGGHGSHDTDDDAMRGGDESHGGDHDHSMMMRELPMGQTIAWMAGTFALMLLAAWITSQFAPISFS
ncbi:MAG: DUF4396 domain-containing protein [Candidatus Binatia bacterium]|nr:DUF4396 domain-containing protein [Candidatus Binatia bacterium]